MSNVIDKSENLEDQQFAELLRGESIEALNALLTKAMAQQRHHSLIKAERLEAVVFRVVKLAQEQPDHSLSAAAALGRLAAVARGREELVYSHVSDIFKDIPPSIDTLDDGEEKFYAAIAVRFATHNWVDEYCYKESIATDIAEKARKELLLTTLNNSKNAAVWFDAIALHAQLLTSSESSESRLKKVRRIFLAMREGFLGWRGALGSGIGESLALCFKKYIRIEIDKADLDVLFNATDHALAILLRVVELRFSYALQAETYALTEQGKKTFGTFLWNQFLSQSEVISDLRVCLLEAALVLARQGKTDRRIMDILATVYSSVEQISMAINNHFKDVKDLEPEIREWWFKAGVVSSVIREVEHKVGNTEDQQIGSLLIEVESSKDAMDKLRRAVVPLLQISDPILAETVGKAALGYAEIAQTARRLARMRKLSTTDIRGHRLEYNPLEHEMLGGHKPGVRMVKVVRDAVQKEFGGRIKTLVKARVVEDQ